MKRFAKLTLVSLILLTGFVLLRGTAPQVATGTWQSGSEMSEARTGAAAVTLDDGRVLVFGGTTSSGGATNAVQVFSDGSWSDLGVVMLDARSGHSATALADGRILLAGGENSSGPLSSLEIYDPASGSFSSAGTLSGARASHGAARLPDGRVLMIGGSDGTNALASSEIYDPESGSVSAGPSLAAPRSGLSVTRLLDGKVLIAGGNNGEADLASTLIYDPADGSIAAGADLSAPRSGHSAILLPHNNSVLISGGSGLASAELYVPWTDSVSATASMASARDGAAGSGVDYSGYAVVAGGSGSESSEYYGYATVMTDLDDYAPGDTVYIFGSGWQPGETVTLHLHEVPEIHDDHTLTAVADESGIIVNSEFAPEEHDRGVRFYVTATGAGSQAQATFTDNVTAVSITSPTSASQVTVTSLPQAVTISFNYSTSTAGATSAIARICSSAACSPASTILASNSKSGMASGSTKSDSINVTLPVGTANSSSPHYTVQVEVTNTNTPPGPTTRTDTKTSAVIVNVPSNTPPVLSLPSDIIAEATSAAGAVVNYVVTATDAEDDPDPTPFCTPASGSTFPLGTTQVDCTVTDSGSLSDSGSFNVTVQDTTPPTIDAHGDENAEATSAAGAIVNYTSPATHDLVDGDGVASCLPASGSQFALGDTTVNCNASDAAGNDAVATSFVVHVVDTTPPDTSIDSGPDDPTNSTSATFTFSGTDLVTAPGDLTFECELDGLGFSSCTSPKMYAGPLGEGSHTFKVQATDEAGNTDPTPAEFTWTIDLTPPTVTVTVGTPDGLAGWFVTSPVSVSVSATDPSNVASFSCTVNAVPVVVGSLAGIGTGSASGSFDVSAEGMNAVVCEATDGVGNSGAASGSSNTTTVKIDTVAPSVVLNAALDSCSLAGNAGWCRGTQTAGFTASDATSGVAAPPCLVAGSASCGFTQSTGTNGSSVMIASGAVSDVAGNSTASINAGPFKIDSVAPSVTITTPPDGASYVLNQVVNSNYGCTDATSLIATCAGPVANGSAIDTSIGSHAFTVSASDNAGNTNSATTNYGVTYDVCVLYDQTKAHKRGSTVPIKLYLCDATGNDVSSASTVVTATGLTKIDNSASPLVEDSGQANSPDNNFRFDLSLGPSGGYIFNLSTKNLPNPATGTWILTFTVSGEPAGTTHTVRFDVK